MRHLHAKASQAPGFFRSLKTHFTELPGSLCFPCCAKLVQADRHEQLQFWEAVMSKYTGVSRIKKRWLSLDEAAVDLGIDAESIRQAMEAGDLDDLPIFVYSGTGRLPACLFVYETDEPFYELPTDRHGESEPIYWPERSRPEWFWLTGFFRVGPHNIKTIAREKTLFRCSVYPSSWWEPKSTASKYDDGLPLSTFVLGMPPAELPGGPRIVVKDVNELFSFDKLRFHAADIAAFRSSHLNVVDTASNQLSSKASSEVGARWPWGSHETEALGHLEAAAKQWWSRYDPTDATTAHTNDEVADWLMKERGVSSRMAHSIASLLRADGLPSGRRR